MFPNGAFIYIWTFSSKGVNKKIVEANAGYEFVKKKLNVNNVFC